MRVLPARHTRHTRRRPTRRKFGAERAVRSALVIVGAPSADDLAGCGERSEPVLVQALVAELAAEALHVRVLRPLAGLYQA